MILIENTQIVGNTAPNIYDAMKPWTHASGAAWWIITTDGAPFVDADGQTYLLHKRTQAELEATPQYQAWAGTQPDLRPTFWLHYTLTPGGTTEIQADGVPLLKNTATDTLSIVATIRATADAASPVIPYEPPVKWPIRIRRGDGSQMMVRVQHSAPGVFPFTLKMPGKDSGRYEVHDADFATVTVGGVTYHLRQAMPLRFDVYEEL